MPSMVADSCVSGPAPWVVAHVGERATVPVPAGVGVIESTDRRVVMGVGLETLLPSPVVAPLCTAPAP